MLVARLQAELYFALQIFLDICTQGINAAVSNTQRLYQCFVHFRQARGFNLLQGHQEVSGFASDVFAMVVLRECQGESLGFANLHATDCIFKFLEHLAFTNQELKIFSLATSKGFAVDLAFEVHGHAIAIHCSFSCSALSESATLLAQDVQSLFNSSVIHFCSQLFNFSSGQITDLYFGEYFENSLEFCLTFSSAFLFGNARLAGNAQTSFLHALGKFFTDLVVQHFVLH